MSKACSLRLAEPELAPALAVFLGRHGCRTEITGDGAIVVRPPHELHNQQAELELLLYVRLWETLHDTRVTVLP